MPECEFIKEDGNKCTSKFVKKGEKYCNSHKIVMQKKQQQQEQVEEKLVKKKKKKSWFGGVKSSFARDAFDENYRIEGFTTRFRKEF